MITPWKKRGPAHTLTKETKKDKTVLLQGRGTRGDCRRSCGIRVLIQEWYIEAKDETEKKIVELIPQREVWFVL